MLGEDPCKEPGVIITHAIVQAAMKSGGTLLPGGLKEYRFSTTLPVDRILTIHIKIELARIGDARNWKGIIFDGQPFQTAEAVLSGKFKVPADSKDGPTTRTTAGRVVNTSMSTEDPLKNEVEDTDALTPKSYNTIAAIMIDKAKQGEWQPSTDGPKKISVSTPVPVDCSTRLCIMVSLLDQVPSAGFGYVECLPLPGLQEDETVPLVATFFAKE